jgi:hypothetical protein
MSDFVAGVSSGDKVKQKFNFLSSKRGFSFFPRFISPSAQSPSLAACVPDPASIF